MTANQIQVGRKCRGQNGFCHLPPCVTPSACTPHRHKGQTPTKRIERTLTTESAEGNRLTYEKDLLNSRKNSNFHKTNHSGFPASVRQPSRLAKTNGKPTKRIVCALRVKCARGNRLTYEKELFNSRKNSRFSKTNHPSFPHALPPMTQITTFFPYMPAMTKESCSQIHSSPPALRSVICLFEARCRATSTCLASVESAIISSD